MNVNYLNSVNEGSVLSRAELHEGIEEKTGYLSEANFRRILRKMLDSGELVRVGRNAYSAAEGRKNYTYEYSAISKTLAEYMEQNNPYLEFVIMELVQLNEFVNHQIAHNVYFLYVEGDYGEFLFDPLKSMFPGKVLLYPDVETFYRYGSEDVIVIERLVSQSPRDKKEKWPVRIEKMLVDLFADDIFSSMISRSEYPAIYEGIFERYAVDENSLLRYAGRRRAKKKILEFVAGETNICLRTVNQGA